MRCRLPKVPFKEVSYHLQCMTFTFEDILPLACVDRYFDRGACSLVACGGHGDLAAEAYGDHPETSPHFDEV